MAITPHSTDPFIGPHPRRNAAAVQETMDAVRGFIKAHPGLRSEEIYTKMGGNTADLKNALERLRAAKKVKTKGKKRSMTYSA
jgi:hypothetical protein